MRIPTALWMLLAVASLIGAGCAAAPTPYIPTASPVMPSPAPPSGGSATHLVQPGDTLWSIGQRYGISHHELMRANRLQDPTDLAVGRRLIIPRLAPDQPLVPLYPSRRWTHIVVHHSATAQGNARVLDRSHRKRGFKNGLGYHFVIDNGTSGRRDGEIEIGHRWSRQMVGAHCNAGGMNQHGIGICLIGDFSNHPLSHAQMKSLVALVQQLRGYYGIPPQNIVRHKDVPGKNTACPGYSFPWGAFRQNILRRAQR